MPFKLRNKFQRETLKIREQTSSHYIIACDILCSFHLIHFSRRGLFWAVCWSMCRCDEFEVEWVNTAVWVENKFWGRRLFLLLRCCFQSGFRKPSRTMCSHDAWFYFCLLSILHEKYFQQIDHLGLTVLLRIIVQSEGVKSKISC